jgi:thioredoxin-related protein
MFKAAYICLWATLLSCTLSAQTGRLMPTTLAPAARKTDAQRHQLNPASSNTRQSNTRSTAKSAAAAAPKVRSLRPAEPVKMNWMTLEEALEKSKTEKRKLLIDVYTDWCGWCKHMDETTYTDPTVVKYLNEHYYAVKFNAEQERDILFRDKTYRFKRSPNGGRGHHELAAEWLQNRLSFPTTVILDEQAATIQPIPGYLDASKMAAIIHYFGGDNHKKTPWETFERQFNAQRSER